MKSQQGRQTFSLPRWLPLAMVATVAGVMMQGAEQKRRINIGSLLELLLDDYQLHRRVRHGKDKVST